MEPDADAGADLVTDDTEKVEEQDAVATPDSGRAPTAEEEQAAERADPPDEETREAYRDMTRKGAEAEGEGRVP